MSLERNDIIKQLKTDLEDYIKTSRGCYINVSEVVRGREHPQLMVNRPAIMIAFEEDESYKSELGEFGGEDVRILRLLLTLICDTEGLGDVDKIYEFVSDVEYFLHTDFTYSDYTTTPKLKIHEGTSKQERMLIADLDIEIMYDIDITSR